MKSTLQQLTCRCTRCSRRKSTWRSRR